MPVVTVVQRRTLTAMFLLLLYPILLSAQLRQVWTTDADFDRGAMRAVNHDEVHDQLQLDRRMQLLPFVNVAASARGTVIRIDANTGAIIGEYRTAPQGNERNPSRTTVDRHGNVWVANRDEPLSGVGFEGSVVKIGIVLGGTRCDKNGKPSPGGRYLKPPFLYSTAVDRDGDGLIRTSMGLGDILDWGAGSSVLTADDECILIYKRLPAHNCRHVSVDAANDVWVGGFSRNSRNASTMMKLQGTTGEMLMLLEDLSCGGYGGLVSSSGTIYSASLNGGEGPLLALSPGGGAHCITDVQGYGVAEDTLGYIWASDHKNARLYKLDAGGAVMPGFPVNLLGKMPRGVAVTRADNHVWVVCSGDNSLERRAPDGSLIKRFDLGAAPSQGLVPTGVAVDINGKVWVTNSMSDNVFRIDPRRGGGGDIDMVVALGPGAMPYNYSDMTGAAFGVNVPAYGSWTVVHDGTVPQAVWERVHWNERLGGDARIVVRARAADEEAALREKSFIEVGNGMPLCDASLRGRFIELFVEFHRGSSMQNNPILLDIAVEGVRPPRLIAPARELCEGDSLLLQGPGDGQDVLWSTGERTPTIVVWRGGAYWYSVRTPAGCTLSSDTVQLAMFPAPLPQVALSAPVLCPGKEVLLTATAGYRRYRWLPGTAADTTRTLRVVAPGTYRVIVENDNGCAGASAEIVIDAPPAPRVTVEAVGGSTICAGSSVTLRATPGFARYAWSTGYVGPDNSITVRAPGVYSVSVRDVWDCEGAADSVTIVVRPEPQVELRAVGDTMLCPGGSVDIAATPGFSEYRWSNGVRGVSNRLTVTLPGEYWVEVMDANGCVGRSNPVRIGRHASRNLRLILPANTALCDDDSLWLGATAGFREYRWSDGLATSAPGRFVRGGGLWYVQGVDSNGCVTASDTVIIGVLPRPLLRIAVDGDTLLCAGDSVTLRASDGFAEYLWSNGATGQELRVAAGGVYHVVGRTALGCVAYSDTVVLHVVDEEPITLRLNGSAELCPGETVEILAPEGYIRYEWSTGVVGSSRAIVVGEAGRYWVRATTAHGCVSMSDTVEVRVAPAVAVRLTLTGSSPLCPHDSVALVATPGFAEYRWSNGIVTSANILVVRDAGSYWVDVRTSAGCTGRSDTLTIQRRPDRMLRLRADGGTVLCNGGTTQLIATEGFVSYRWSTGNSGNAHALMVSAAGRYHVESVDEFGCVHRSDTVEIMESGELHPVIALSSPRLCPGASVTLDAGAGFAQHLWSTGDTTRSIVVTTPGRYTLHVRSFQGCEGDTAIVVRFADAPVILATTDTLCEGETAVLRVQGDFTELHWSNGDSGTEIQVQQPGLYHVLARTAEGCQLADSIRIVEWFAPPVAIIGERAVCPGQIETYTIPVIPGFEVRWSIPGAVVIDSSDEWSRSVRWIVEGVHRIEAQVRDSRRGCAVTATLSVQCGVTPMPVVLGERVLCDGAVGTLRVRDWLGTLTWVLPDGRRIRDAGELSIDMAGDYWLRIDFRAGCTDSMLIHIAAAPRPVVAIDGATDFCDGTWTMLRAQGMHVRAQWHSPDGVYEGDTLRTAVPGWHVLHVWNEAGCAARDSVFLRKLALPLVTVDGLRELSVGDSLLVTAAGNFQHCAWRAADGTLLGRERSVMLHDTGQYTIEAMSLEGCVTVVEFRVPPRKGALTVVAVPDMRVDPGQHIRVPILLRGRSGVPAGNVIEGAMKLRFKSAVLVPVSPTPPGEIDGDERVIFLRGRMSDESDTVAILDLVATLGAVRSTPLHIEEFAWDDAAIGVQMVDGSVTLNVCEEGGERLFDAVRRLRLLPNHPNPFGSGTVFEFELFERCRARLEVLDGGGRLVAVAFDADADPGHYSVPFRRNDLPSAVYVLRLSSGESVLQRLIHLTK